MMTKLLLEGKVDRKRLIRIGFFALALLLFLVMLIMLRHVLTPLFLALGIAYVCDPIIDKFETWKINRTLGIVILIAAIVLAVLGFALYIIPKILDQVDDLRRVLPGYWDKFEARFLPNLEQYYKTYQEEITAWVSTHGGRLLRNVSAGIATSFASVGAFFANLLGLLIVPILAFYLLRDFDLMKAKISDLIPGDYRGYVVELSTELDRALGGFLKGQLTVALILSLIYALGLWIAGCPASLLIALIAGFANLVPYLGIALGLVPAVLLTYLSGNPMWQVILSAATFGVGQMLEGMVITPKIVGESTGLHPVFVMVALMVGGTYFGITGMILALPVSAVLVVIVRRLHRYYVNSPFFLEDHLEQVSESKAKG